MLLVSGTWRLVYWGAPSVHKLLTLEHAYNTSLLIRFKASLAIILCTNLAKNKLVVAFTPSLAQYSFHTAATGDVCSIGTASMTLLYQTTSSTDVVFRQMSTIPPTSPLSKNTYAGQVENAIIEKYGEKDTYTILQWWHLLEQDYIHCEYVHDNDVQSKESSNCYQYTHSYVYVLTCKPFWDINQQPWGNKLSIKYKTIQKEFLDVTVDMNKLKEEGITYGLVH